MMIYIYILSQFKETMGPHSIHLINANVCASSNERLLDSKQAE
jgi:hypothetical protein